MNDIKKKISSTENMSKITKAVQMVSVAKLQKTEARVSHFKNYKKEVKKTLSSLKDSEYLKEHLFVKGRKEKGNGKIGCILITSNRGLVGGYNNNLFKMLKSGGSFNKDIFEALSDKVNMSNEYKFYVSGQKGAVFAKNELPADATSHYVFPDEINFTNIVELSNKVITDYLKGEIDGAIILHQDFVSKLEQIANRVVLLPIEFKEEKNQEKLGNSFFEIEPNEKDVTNQLLVQYIKTAIYEAFLSANLAEHAARMNAMSNATDNADDIIKESKLLYNRARQAAITQELNEIVAGANAVNV